MPNRGIKTAVLCLSLAALGARADLYTAGVAYKKKDYAGAFE